MSWFQKKPRNRLYRHDLKGLDSRIRMRIRLQRQTKTIALFLGGALGFGILGWGIWLGLRKGAQEMFSENALYRITDIPIENRGEILKPNQLLSYLQVRRGQNLLAVDLDQLRRALEILPVVEKAEIFRQFPNRLIIRVLERIPIANISANTYAAQYQIDCHGVIMDLLPYQKNADDLRKKLAALPAITGTSVADLKIGRVVSSPEILWALVLIQKMGYVGLGSNCEIGSIDVSRRGILMVNTTDGTLIKIGASETYPKIDQQLKRLADIFDKARYDPNLKFKRMATADLTVKNDIPVVWVSAP